MFKVKLWIRTLLVCTLIAGITVGQTIPTISNQAEQFGIYNWLQGFTFGLQPGTEDMLSWGNGLVKGTGTKTTRIPISPLTRDSFMAHTNDSIWFEDSLPAGAIPAGGEGWNWVSGNPAPHFGQSAHQSINPAPFPVVHGHSFSGATDTMRVKQDNVLITYVFIDPANAPSELMLEWRLNDGTAWEHRAYWGANVIPFGADGTASRRYMGPIPTDWYGRWVRLEVPAGRVGLDNVSVDGMSFLLYGGRATWDRAGLSKNETVFVEDGVPAGATIIGAWNWVSNPDPYSGGSAHQSGIAPGIEQHYFYGATNGMKVNSEDNLFTYVYLDPVNPPEEIMIQYHTNVGGWEHRAYWGQDIINFGEGFGGYGDDKPAHKFIAPLPPTGKWVRLELRALFVGLEGKVVDGMSFDVYGGRATFDRSGKSHTETVWVDDATPEGATQFGDLDGWSFASAQPKPYSGNLSHQSPSLVGVHQHFFTGATDPLRVNVGDNLFAYIYIDAFNPPDEIMLQWNDGASWEHRAYWGSNNIGWGTNGFDSRRNMGPIPKAWYGNWVRLEAPANRVGLENKVVSGMAFTLYNGKANWDRAGKISNLAQVAATPAYDKFFRGTCFGAPSYDTIMLLAYSSGSESNNWLDGFSSEEKVAERNEIERLGDYLLYPGRYNTATKFIITNWEGDHAFSDGNDKVWVEESLPEGATAVEDSDGWNWISSNPKPDFGILAHQSANLPGVHQHYFEGATEGLFVETGQKLVAYVYLDPANPPREIMLQWKVGGSFDHRAYWGEDLIGFGGIGVDGPEHRYIGALPQTGKWVRLEAPASLVGLENKAIDGMAFTLYDGRAAWDHAGVDLTETWREGPNARWDDFKNWIQAKAEGVGNAVFFNEGQGRLFSSMEFFTTFPLVRGQFYYYTGQDGMSHRRRCGDPSDDATRPNKFRCLSNYVAPQVNVDYYSYSSYESINDRYCAAGIPGFCNPANPLEPSISHASLKSVLKANLGFALDKIDDQRFGIGARNFIIGEWGISGGCPTAPGYQAEMRHALRDADGFNASYAITYQIIGGIYDISTNGVASRNFYGRAFVDELMNVPGASPCKIITDGSCALTIVTCDNSYKMYFNDFYIGSGEDWTKSQTYHLTAQQGKNVLAIKGIDADGIAALLAEMQIAGQRLGSNMSWKVSLTEQPNWTDVNFDDSGWENATDYGPYGIAPWGTSVIGMPLDTPARWIWSSNNDAHNMVYFRASFFK
jgi:hypothetical protein